ncbi:hypothetical protein VNO80_01740 [Phaseolus coccineus]|uniref:Uncharacterized protein n=1 Tax=Phaseolus coccineus TaxID=3886 RepID=A0AAN9RTG8_PHACN
MITIIHSLGAAASIFLSYFSPAPNSILYVQNSIKPPSNLKPIILEFLLPIFHTLIIFLQIYRNVSSKTRLPDEMASREIHKGPGDSHQLQQATSLRNTITRAYCSAYGCWFLFKLRRLQPIQAAKKSKNFCSILHSKSA